MIRRTWKYWLFITLCSLGLVRAVQALEVRDVRLVGLFTDAAVLKIGGKQRLLKVGHSSPEGVRLVSADSAGADVLVEGIEHRLSLTRDIPGSYRKRTAVSEQININARGQYLTPGAINGRSVTFLVDTGATSVAMNTEQARSLGVAFAGGTPGHATTAGGMVKAYSVVLKSVKVGEIEVRNVRAAVLEGVYPTHVLLGMSYLTHVRISENAGLMTLTKTY